MGALFTQRIATADCELRALAAFRRSSADRDQPQGSRRLSGTPLSPPAFILVGNEAQGLPEAYEAECDTLVKIPMLGKADSLNAAVATSVMAYEVLNQWRRA
jgi:TrmH family RNA methyltransferase